LSLYRIHLKWKDKEIQLTAKNLDLTHPYFVSIKNLVFEKENKYIINPSENDIRKTFGRADHFMIPFQSVSLIEEIIKPEETKVVSFSIVEENRKNPEED